MVGLFIAATAANTQPTGRRAFAARALVTLAVALVASDALQQFQRWQQRTQASLPEGAGAGAGGGGGMAALWALVSDKVAAGGGCEPVVGLGDGDDGDAEGAGEAVCTAVSQSLGERERERQTE